MAYTRAYCLTGVSQRAESSQRVVGALVINAPVRTKQVACYKRLIRNARAVLLWVLVWHHVVLACKIDLLHVHVTGVESVWLLKVTGHVVESTTLELHH